MAHNGWRMTLGTILLIGVILMLVGLFRAR